MPGPSRRSLDDPDRHAGRWQGVPADLPALVVAFGAGRLPGRLPAGREWLAVDHGEQLVLTVLRPTPQAEEGMRRLRER
ncbi:hypothetical protein, partial [Nonomuraea dietziae]|uniref:hypothetical protein n=1 Tax=Nonomuraea dietziae TaxID=65515 RepID=UPI00342E532B